MSHSLLIAAASLRVRSSIPLSESDQVLSDQQGILLFGAMFTLAGLALLYWIAWDRITRFRQYLGMESFDPHTGNQGSGLTAVSGPIDDTGETVESPMTGEECVAYEKKIQELRNEYKYDRAERRRMKRSSVKDDEDADKRVWRWKTVDSDRDEVPFHVETDHGPVEVRPAGSVLDVSTEKSEKTSLLKRTLYKGIPGIRIFQGFLSAPRHRFENHISPGDDVLVIGDVHPVNSAESATVGTASADNAEMFRITTRSKSNLVVRSFVVALLSCIPGLLFLLIGVGVLGVALA